MTAVAQRSNGTKAAEAAGRIAPVPFEHEELVVRRGARSGRYVTVAIHSTALGPALGGVRMWHYPETIDASRDALRLAAGMTLKAAAAGLELGGGKGVICAGPRAPQGDERRALLLDFGDLVESLGGRYVTAEDVGIGPEDLVAVAERTGHLTGLPPERGGSGDPSPFTAAGIVAAMRACARARYGSADLGGRRVAVIGLGHVGTRLVHLLADAGATVSATDIDPGKRAVAARAGARWVAPQQAITEPCEILAPCALGGMLDVPSLPLLRCQIVCGAANNQLAGDHVAALLRERGILYAPDFIVNAGGLIHVYKEIRGYTEEHAWELVHGIEATMGRILEAADGRDTTPLQAAIELAHERLDAATTKPAIAG